MASKITITGMEFYAYHGCFIEEKTIGTRFKVDVVLYCNIQDAAINDDLSKTINYQMIYNEVKKVMEESVNLLETLCYDIIMRIREKFALVEKSEVTVYKLNPAIGGKTESVSVTIEV